MAADTPSSEEATTLVIVEDHRVVRAGLRRLLEDLDHVTVLGEAGTLREADELVEVKRPNLVLLDLELPDGSGLDLLATIRRRFEGMHVLILSMFDDPDIVESAFAAGADGYLVKDAAETELADAIEAIGHGDRYVHPALGAKLARAAMDRANDPLTPRERDIVRLLALGHTNQEVAAQLYLSVRTVESHRSSAMAKLKLHGRSELVRWAIESGLLDTRKPLGGNH